MKLSILKRTLFLFFIAISTVGYGQMNFVVDSLKPASCNGDVDGHIGVTGSGGTIPYTYQWSNGLATQDISNLPGGLYSLTVFDASSDSFVLSNVRVVDPYPVSVIVDTIVNQLCHGDSTGGIGITICGGSGNDQTVPVGNQTTVYTDILTRGYWFIAPRDFTINSVFVPTDASTGAQNVQIVKFDSIPSNFPNPGNPFVTQFYAAGVNTTLPIEVCIPVKEGEKIGILGARGNVSNLDNSYGPNGYTSNIDGIPVFFERLVYQGNIALAQAPNLSLVRNKNFQIGRVEFTYNVDHITYSWSTGDTIEDVFSGSGTPTQLTAGIYTVTAVDENGCTVVDSIEVTEPDPLQVQIDSIYEVTCHGGNDGRLDVKIVGGTKPYNYNWAHGFSGQDPFGLTEGTYTVTVTDENNCTVTDSMQGIYMPHRNDSIEVSIDLIDTVDCFGDTTGAIFISDTGGQQPFSYQWNNGGGTNQDAINLSAGSYKLTVTDNLGCTQVAGPYQVGSQTDIIIQIDSTNQVSCFGGNDGNIYTTISGGVPGYTYLWNGGAAGQDPLNLLTGTYTLTLVDALGCTKLSPPIPIIEPSAPLIATVDSIVNSLCPNTTEGGVYISPTGGTLPYTYVWSNLQTSQDISGLTPGVYSGTVFDARGCQYNVPPANISSVNDFPQGSLDSNFIFACNSVVLDAGLDPSGPVTYSWSTGQNSQTITVTKSGTYIINYYNVCGVSTDAAAVTIEKQPVALFGYLSLDLQTTFNNFSNTNSAGASYSWNFGDGDSSSLAQPVHTYPNTGNYVATLTVTNSCGTSNYSDTIFVIAQSLEDLLAENVFNVYPNPASNQMTIELNAEYDKSLTLNVYSAIGQELLNEEIGILYSGWNNSFNVSDWEEGTYFIRITDGETSVSKPIVVIK